MEIKIDLVLFVEENLLYYIYIVFIIFEILFINEFFNLVLLNFIGIFNLFNCKFF